MTHTITGKRRRVCPCETPALDGDAARAGSVALALTARQVWLRDFPPLAPLGGNFPGPRAASRERRETDLTRGAG